MKRWLQTLTTAQRVIVLVAGLGILAAFLYPPWQMDCVTGTIGVHARLSSVEYAPLWMPNGIMSGEQSTGRSDRRDPSKWVCSAAGVDLSTLTAEFAGILVVSALFLLALTRKAPVHGQEE